MAHRILVVDDVPDTAEAVSILLTTLGHEAKPLTDPRQAIETARIFRPAMVLLDIGMPHINGYQLCPLLRQALEPAAVQIVAVTAWGSQTDRAHSRAAGFDAHLVKPIDSALLQAIIEELLGPAESN